MRVHCGSEALMVNEPLFNVSGSIVRKVNSLLGVSAKPHFAAYSHGTPVATGCPEWELRVPFEPHAETQAIDAVLEQVRNLVADDHVCAYISISSWWSLQASVARAIVLCPTTDQFDVIRFEFGDKAGLETGADYYIELLHPLDAHYGLNLTGAGYQTIEFVLKHVPTGHAAQTLTEHLYRLTDSVLEGIANARRQPFDWGSENPLELLTQYDFGSGRVALWFD
jgi:hypothetical protein